MIKSREQARRSVPPEIPKLLLECILSGFNDYYTGITEEYRATLGPTAKAAIINDRMIFRARQIMQGHPHVQFFPRHGRDHLFITNQNIQVEVKLKKLTLNRRPSNIFTQTVKAYHDQEKLPPPFQLRMLEEDDIDVTNLIAGYQTNRSKTGVEAVYILCPQGNRNRWEWKLDFTPEPSILLPSTPITEPPLTKPVLPKSKLANKVNI